MTPTLSLHPWSEEALFNKALLYVGRMEAHTAEDWEFGFWSSLSLELLARSALAHISPVLLADGSNWRNTNYALGAPLTLKKFSPTSVPTNEVIARLGELVPEFTQEIAGYCIKHSNRRNSELHSGELAFAGLGTSEWLPRFYLACKVLLGSSGRELSSFLTDVETAQSLIDSLEDATAKAVDQDIKAHAKVWSNKDDDSKEESIAQATAWATRQAGHRVACPACQSPALVRGIPSGAVTTRVDEDDEVFQRQTVLPSALECIACGLRVTGFSKLLACGLGDAFTATSTYSPAEFFGLYTQDEIDKEVERKMRQLDDDFNEY